MPRAAEPRVWYRSGRDWLCVLMIAVSMPLADPCVAATLSGTPENYQGLLSKLKPGDTLRLAPGLYMRGLPLHGLSGTPGKPILIVGDQSGTGTVFVARPGANTISIKNAAHLEMRSLRLDGAGLSVDAVKAEGTSAFAHHIVLEDLTIVNHGADQQAVGISTKCPAWGWVIRGNVIHGAGTGIYLGNSDGSAPFVGGVIENNLVVDSLGYNLQIKHQAARAAMMPAEPMRTVIRHNVFSKANGGSSGPSARPNVLLGHFPEEGAGRDDEYHVYGNFFHDNPHEALLQAEGNIVVHHNIFVNAHGDALRIQPHQALPKRVTIAHNTVLADNAGILVTGGDSRFRQSVVANAIFAGQPLVGGAQHRNVTAPYEAASEFLVAPFAEADKRDFSPRGRSLDLPSAMDDASLPPGQVDFYGRTRQTSNAGAIVGGMPVPWHPGLSRPPARSFRRNE